MLPLSIGDLLGLVPAALPKQYNGLLLKKNLSNSPLRFDS
jgi:hypothetical protein